MPRHRRFVEPNVSLHVIQRGNNRMTIFEDDADFELFVTLLKSSMQRYEVMVHGFALMSTHYHLVLTPPDKKRFGAAMKLLDGQYVRYFNRKNDRIGTVWNGRPNGIGLHDSVYWLTCLRYIELNPVAAGLVDRPEAYPWSSYIVHAFGDVTSWLAPHPNYDSLGATAAERQSKYRDMCKSLLTPAELVLQKYSQ